MAEQHGKEGKATASAEVIRPLGSLEKLLSALHLVRQYCAVLVTSRYEPPAEFIHGSSDEAIRAAMRSAVARTVLGEPLLQVVQYKEDSASPAWRRVAEIDLDHHIRWKPIPPQEDYEAQLEETTLKTMDAWFTDAERRPGWRVLVFHRENDLRALDVLFAWNHAHADGIGGKVFHEQLVRHLNEPDSGDEPHLSPTLTLPDVTERFPPPLEKLVKYSLSTKYAVSTLWQELKPPFLAKQKDYSAHWCPIRHEPMTSAHRILVVDAAAVRNLLKSCRRHETSMTGLLHALVATSLSLQLRPQPKSFKACTPIDHRRYVPSRPAGFPDFDAKTSMMNMFTTMWHDLDPAVVEQVRSKGLQVPSTSPLQVIAAVEPVVWSIAATIRHEIQLRVDKGPKDDVVGVAKFVNDWRSFHRDAARKPRVGSWLVTNLGVLDGGDGPWKITSSSFLNPSEMCSAAVCITVLSVKDGSMAVGINWQKCVLDASVVEQLASNLQAWLTHLGADGSQANGMAH